MAARSSDAFGVKTELFRAENNVLGNLRQVLILESFKTAKKNFFVCHIHSSVRIPSSLAALKFIFIVHKYCPPVINTSSDCKLTERAVQGGGGRFL